VVRAIYDRLDLVKSREAVRGRGKPCRA
jgi:hypothetical protein